jgi:hypothetical protein
LLHLCWWDSEKSELNLTGKKKKASQQDSKSERDNDTSKGSEE